jgi:predicted GTPase
MGETGTGKSTVSSNTTLKNNHLANLRHPDQFVNAVTGSHLEVSHGHKSCTSEVKMSKAFQVGEHSLTLIDTPGFDDTSKTDADILREITVFLGQS